MMCDVLVLRPCVMCSVTVAVVLVLVRLMSVACCCCCDVTALVAYATCAAESTSSSYRCYLPFAPLSLPVAYSGANGRWQITVAGAVALGNVGPRDYTGHGKQRRGVLQVRS